MQMCHEHVVDTARLGWVEGYRAVGKQLLKHMLLRQVAEFNSCQDKGSHLHTHLYTRTQMQMKQAQSVFLNRMK